MRGRARRGGVVRSGSRFAGLRCPASTRCVRDGGPRTRNCSTATASRSTNFASTRTDGAWRGLRSPTSRRRCRKRSSPPRIGASRAIMASISPRSRGRAARRLAGRRATRRQHAHDAGRRDARPANRARRDAPAHRAAEAAADARGARAGAAMVEGADPRSLPQPGHLSWRDRGCRRRRARDVRQGAGRDRRGGGGRAGGACSERPMRARPRSDAAPRRCVLRWIARDPSREVSRAEISSRDRPRARGSRERLHSRHACAAGRRATAAQRTSHRAIHVRSRPAGLRTRRAAPSRGRGSRAQRR